MDPSIPLQRLASVPDLPLDRPNRLPSGNSGNPNIVGLRSALDTPYGGCNQFAIHFGVLFGNKFGVFP